MTRRTLVRTGGLFYILVDLEVQTMKIDMGGVKDLVLLEELMTRQSNIIMMKEEVLVIPKKIQDMEVL
jgi:hypothetical protein